MKIFAMNWMAPKIAFEGEAEGGSGGGISPADAPATPLTETPSDGAAAPAPADAAKPSDAESAEAVAKAEGDKGGEKPEDGDQPSEFKLTAPEGMDDLQGDFDKFSESASKWLSENPNAKPADALKWAAESQAEIVRAAQAQAVDQHKAQLDTWVNEAKADPEIGGSNFDANMGVARLAIEKFGSDGLKAALDESGLGNHPEVMRFAFKAGQALKEASIHSPNAASSGKTNIADALYKS